MTNTFYIAEAEKNFSRSLKRGKRLVSKWFYPFLGDRRLLSLKELNDIETTGGESFKGVSDIAVNKIIGSEDRSSDFSEGFMPTKSWMEKRWNTVWILMYNGNLEEPIDVLEYGGVYFVRDGNHRVSVAKSQKREFITARVTSLHTPLTLSADLTRNNLDIFRNQTDFERKTGFFSQVPQARLNMRRQSSWEILNKEIACWSPSWFERHKQDFGETDLKKQYHVWYYWLEKTVLSNIKKQSLHYLFPGWGDMDVAMEIIKLWNTYSCPDDISIEELYSDFIKRARKKRFFLAPVHFIFDKINYLSRTACDERCLFYERSYIREIRPEFQLPSDLGKRYWRKLYKELFHDHYQHMKKRLGRPPYHNELIEDWYDNVWLPRAAG